VIQDLSKTAMVARTFRPRGCLRWSKVASDPASREETAAARPAFRRWIILCSAIVGADRNGD